MTTDLYADAVLLQKDQHLTLGLDRQAANYNFARKILNAPIAAAEFEMASRRLPIVFVTVDGVTGPVAITGLNPAGHNVLVDDAGQWDGYVPAWYRRYPFAHNAQGQLCFDANCTWIGDGMGEALFDDAGYATATLSGINDLLDQHKTDLAATIEFSAKLQKLELLQDVSVNFASAGKDIKLEGMKMVNVARLKALSDDQILELFKGEQLGWVYFHLASLQHIGDIVN